MIFYSIKRFSFYLIRTKIKKYYQYLSPKLHYKNHKRPDQLKYFNNFKLIKTNTKKQFIL